MEYSKILIYWFKKHHKLSIAKSVALLAVFEVEIGSVLCRNALWEDEFPPSFLRNLLTANKRSNSIPKQSHSAIRHYTDPAHTRTLSGQ